MSKQEIIQAEAQKQEVPAPITGLSLLRMPFPENQVSKLPKATKAQNEAVKKDFKQGIRCTICGGWHHPKVVHLDYVGHAALTDRLLDADAAWNWEPVAINENGTPALDPNGGMWIRLTVCGQTRLGYGHADGKQGGDAIKEVIGDAMRNAAMRFGAALDLWHKGDLHGIADAEPVEDDERTVSAQTINAEQYIALRDTAEAAGVPAEKICAAYSAPSFEQFPAADFMSAMARLQKTIDAAKAEPKDADLDGDAIPYEGK